MASQNRGKSNGNKSSKCGLHYKDIHGHVRRIVKLMSNIEILRSNCKMINAKSIQNATKLHNAESKIADEKRKYNSFIAKHECKLRS
ncbi:hypothetical protein C2G38_2173205 [Gigaspora rosea]|uniref:Uncharacterized protein n=1 Tax=Gigaspora rosea TaxID=44941 RepID=A0A397VS17_9GLOM|nr:hypothetical protein C2G38_2173205 [Gigaspora rosea]